MSYDPYQQRGYGQRYPPPVVPGQPYGSPPTNHPPMSYDRPAPRRRRPRWPHLALAAAVLLLAGALWTAYDRGQIFKDSGVEACEAMRDGTTTFSGKPADDQSMTEAQYRELRKVFEDSRHDDLRDHGTKLIDIVWQMSQVLDDESDSAGALAYLGPLTTQMTGLQSACADQGIIVNLKPST